MIIVYLGKARKVKRLYVGTILAAQLVPVIVDFRTALVDRTNAADDRPRCGKLEPLPVWVQI